MAEAMKTAPEDRPAWVLLAVEARARGFRNATCFRRWCARHNVTVLADAKMRWVRSRDVDRALDALAAPANDDAAVRDAVERLTGGAR